MPDGARLLQMLEPAVRPVAAAGAPARTATAPFEQRRFDDLLAEFRQSNPVDGTPVAEDQATTPADTAPARPSHPLADLGRIENASLRDLIAQHPPATAQQPTAA